MREPMRPEDVRGAARAFEALQPSPALELRLRASLAERRRPSPWSTRVAWAGALAFAAGVAAGWWLRPSPAPMPTDPIAVAPPPSRVAVDPSEQRVASSECTVAPDAAGLLRLPAGCRVELAASGIELHAWTATTIRPTARGVAMPTGLAAFAVKSVPAGAPPVEIDVGPAIVRVIGTRFVIGNEHGSGHLDLVEGRVELVQGDRVLDVEEGRRVSWTAGQVQGPEPDDATPVPVPAVPVPAVPVPAVPGPSVGPPSDDARAQRLATTLEQVARHRRRREYAEALTRLDALGQRGWDRATGAVLSYERGTLLEAAGRTADACAHWARHLDHYRGVGPADVEPRRQRLECGDD